MNTERNYYLDYLRIISVLLLFPVHTFMIWNDFGQKFYIWGGENKLLSSLIVIINPWFMPILFVIAGICAKSSLKKRTVRQFISERINKLFIPFISCLIFIVPFQTLFSRKYFYDYQGSIFENIEYFFTHLSDFTGYDGCFTPGHLWFILFLFIISLLSLLIYKIAPYEKVNGLVSKLNIWMIIGLFIFVWLAYYIGNIGGFSIGKNLVLYLLGYYVISNENVLTKLDMYRTILLNIFFTSVIILIFLYYKYSFYGDFTVNLIGWVGICAFIPFAKKYLNKNSTFLVYFNKASFTIYLLHQSVLVALAYYVLPFGNDIFIQVAIILVGSLVLTIGLYELIKRIPYVRFLFGIK